MFQKKTYTVEEAKKKLEYYCAYQERCHKEVRIKLKEMSMIPEAIDHVVVHLIQHNFLNEERFARTFVQGKFNIKKWGKHRLTLELKQKNISKANVNQAINEINDEIYIKTFDELAEKQFLKINEANKFKKKKKLIDYLVYRGWESYLVYEKVNELMP